MELVAWRLVLSQRARAWCRNHRLARDTRRDLREKSVESWSLGANQSHDQKTKRITNSIPESINHDPTLYLSTHYYFCLPCLVALACLPVSVPALVCLCVPACCLCPTRVARCPRCASVCCAVNCPPLPSGIRPLARRTTLPSWSVSVAVHRSRALPAHLPACCRDRHERTCLPGAHTFRSLWVWCWPSRL